jgi:hypothetical protein
MGSKSPVVNRKFKTEEISIEAMLLCAIDLRDALFNLDDAHVIAAADDLVSRIAVAACNRRHKTTVPQVVAFTARGGVARQLAAQL